MLLQGNEEKGRRGLLNTQMRDSALFILFMYSSLPVFNILKGKLGFYLAEYKGKTENSSALNKIKVFISLIDKKSEARQPRNAMVALLCPQDPCFVIKLCLSA